MLIVDSSAVVAMMLSEPGADALAVRLAAEPQGQRLIAAPNYVEAGTVLAGRRREPLQAIAHLDAFLKQFDIAIAPVMTNWRVSPWRPASATAKALAPPPD
jgi:ribonuclease VapC